MIIDTRDNLRRYASLNPKFEIACAFLERPDLDRLAPGRHVISEAGDVFAIITRESGLDAEDGHLEAHRKYIDIQYVIKGEHRIGWLSAKECMNVSIPYAAERDIVFFSDAPRFQAMLPRDHFAILFPEDAHAPTAVHGRIDKIVIKVPVAN